MAPQAFQRALGRSPRRSETFGVPLRPKLALSKAALYQYWHPQRDGVEPGPKDFVARLKALNPDLDVCKPPARAPLASHPWLVWYRRDRITHHLSPGWMLLFCWQTRSYTDDGAILITPLPLDDRVFANLYRISAKEFGSAEAYFTSIKNKLIAEREAEDKAQTNYRHDRAADLFQAQKIKNIGQGSKFALHHDGTVVPGKNEAAWAQSNEQAMLPSEVLKEREAAKERRRR